LVRRAIDPDRIVGSSPNRAAGSKRGLCVHRPLALHRALPASSRLRANTRCSCRARDLRKSLRLSAYTEILTATRSSPVGLTARSCTGALESNQFPEWNEGLTSPRLRGVRRHADDRLLLPDIGLRGAGPRQP